MSLRPWAAIAIALVVTILPAWSVHGDSGRDLPWAWLYDVFDSSPFQSDGGWWVVEGAGLERGQFWYDPVDHSLVTRVDSRLATTKLVRALPRALGGSDSFEFGALLLIQSEGFHASPYAFFEIAFGLTNSATTGTDRSGGLDGGPGEDPGDNDTYDTAEWDFFPNISPVFGGPTVGPTIVGGRAGDAWYDNFAFNFGPGTDLADEIAEGLLSATGLPLDTLLDARVIYDAARKLVYMRIWALKPGGWRELPIRVPPTDVSGLDPFFVVDRIAISLYEDAYNPSQDDPSLTATVRYYGLYVVADRARQMWGKDVQIREWPDGGRPGIGQG
jgi:hypothetical protein